MAGRSLAATSASSLRQACEVEEGVVEEVVLEPAREAEGDLLTPLHSMLKFFVGEVEVEVEGEAEGEE